MDNVNHPKHYKTGSIEVFDFMCSVSTPEELRGYIKLNIIKYISRERNKGADEDLYKAQWYLNKYLEYMERQNRKKIEVLSGRPEEKLVPEGIMIQQMACKCTHASPECHHDAGLLPSIDSTVLNV